MIRTVDNSLDLFFGRVFSGDISDKEIEAEVKKLTDDFNLSKLEALRIDYICYFEPFRISYESTFNNIDLAGAMLKLKPGEVPYRPCPLLELDKTGKPLIGRCIDKAALIDPDEFLISNKFLEDLEEEIEQARKKAPSIQYKSTRTESLKNQLTPYKFFELDKLKDLSHSQTDQLLYLLCKEQLPYQIAMLNFLGFITHVEIQHSTSKTKMYSLVATVLQANGRAVKGNILTLTGYSTEDRDRYTAFLHKEEVEKDYENLK